MAAVDIGSRNVTPVPAADDLDDLFDYNVDSVFRDVDTNMDVSAPSNQTARPDGKDNAAGLGIDEEIKVTKKRVPIPKLDDNRLLSSAGIPKLRRITKDRLKFKGKGHEYSDVARLLNVYQLWLDELYPRAKFADGLAIIEKLGHSKRMQTMRREWINEGKPKDTLESFESGSQRPKTKVQDSDLVRVPQTVDSTKGLQNTSAIDGIEEAPGETYRPVRDIGTTQQKNALADSLFVSDDEEVGDQPPEDDLDALLAEGEATIAGSPTADAIDKRGETGRIDDYDDEMEAMAGLDDMW